MSTLDYRSWGETRNCHGCRYWSEMIAQAIGGRPLEAMCLSNTGSHRHTYTTRTDTCEAWQSGELGAIDDPGGDPYSE
jgi:hypothetical protein